MIFSWLQALGIGFLVQLFQAGWLNNARILGSTVDLGLVIVVLVCLFSPGAAFRWVAALAVMGEIMGSSWLGQYTLMLVGIWLVIHFASRPLKQIFGVWSNFVVAALAAGIAEFWGNLFSGIKPNWSYLVGFALNFIVMSFLIIVVSSSRGQSEKIQEKHL